MAEAVQKPGQQRWVAWAPQPGPQEALATCPLPDILYGGARGGGKTDGIIGSWLAHWRDHGKLARGMIVRRTYDELEEVLARLLDVLIPLGARYRAGKKTFVMPGGSSSGGFLKLRYLERDADASRYQGHSYTFLGVDEAGNFPDPSGLDKLRATLRSTRGVPTRQILSANPGGPGHEWLKKRYIDPAPPFTPHTDPDSGEARVYIPSRLEDNPLLAANDPNYRNRLRQSGPAWLVQAWLEGDWNATPEGGIVKAGWFRRYAGDPPPDAWIVQSWDTASKDKQINDYSVCTTWAVSKLGYYLLDVHREHHDFPALKRASRSLAQRWSPRAVLIEDKGSGTSLIQELRAETTIPVIAIEPEGEKVMRMVSATPAIESGLVYLPEAAPWLLDYELEVTIFPLSPFDDQVDSTSQFLNWIANRTPTGAWSHASAGRRDSYEDA